MELWKHPRHYFGETWYDYYVFIGRHRDSSELDQSNFEVGLERIGGECWDYDEDNTGDKTWTQVCIVRENNYAVGWVEWIAIHKDTITVYESPRSKGKIYYPEIIDKANEIEDYLENVYECLDEFHYSDLQYNNLYVYLLLEFHGNIEKVNRYFDELSESRGLYLDDLDNDLISEINSEEEEDNEL